MEAEVFSMLLIRNVGEDGDSDGVHVARPEWMRVITMEIMCGLLVTLLCQGHSQVQLLLFSERLAQPRRVDILAS